jgi:hypothetical protein
LQRNQTLDAASSYDQAISGFKHGISFHAIEDNIPPVIGQYQKMVVAQQKEEQNQWQGS